MALKNTFESLASQCSYQSSDLEMNVRIWNGNGLEINVQPEDTLSFVLSSCLLKPLHLPRHFSITLKGKEVTNFNLTFRQLGAENNSILHVQPLEDQVKKQLAINIGVFYQRERYYIRVRKEHTIQKLKNQINAIVNLPVKSQRLFYRGIELKNEEEIGFYQLANDSLLTLVNFQNPKNEEKQTSNLQKSEAMTNTNSVLEKPLQKSIQPCLRACRSEKQQFDSAQLCYEVKIKQKVVDDSDEDLEDLQGYDKHKFVFAIFQTVQPTIKDANALRETGVGSFILPLQRSQQKCSIQFEGVEMVI